ncbi:MAG: hypothetical protein ACO1RT_11275 [Planctomycetaceae bacterium]
MSHVSPPLPIPSPSSLPLDWEQPTSRPRVPAEIGGCGLPVEPLDPATIRLWEGEVGGAADGVPAVGGAVQAELSGFEDDDDLGGGDVPADDDADDEFDDFDDIDEDDFDDEFDDDFEEELDDDYEIEIEDEISAEFGLSGVADVDIEVDIEDIDVDSLDDVDIDAGDDVDEKE